MLFALIQWLLPDRLTLLKLIVKIVCIFRMPLKIHFLKNTDHNGKIS